MSQKSKILYRSESDRILGGICGGIGEYLDIDPNMVRLFWVLIVLFGGSGIFVYILLWIFLPTESKAKGKYKAEETVKQNLTEIKDKASEVAKDVKDSIEK